MITKKPVFNLQHCIETNGKRVYLSINGCPVMDQEGNIESCVFSIEDVTDKVIVDKALKESEERYRTLFNTIQESFALHEIILDESGKPCNYRFLDVNPAFERVLGLKKEDIVGKTVLDIFPDVEEFWIDTYGEVALTGKFVSFENYNRSLDKFFEVIAFSPKLGQVAVLFLDITYRKKYEKEREILTKELVEKNKELEQIIYISSHDLRSPLVNIHGFSKELRHSFNDIVTILDLDNVNISSSDKQKLDFILNNEIPQSLEYIFKSTAKMDLLLSGLLKISRAGRVELNIKLIKMNELISNVIETLGFEIKKENISVYIDELPDCYGDEIQINQVFTNLIENSIKYRDRNKNSFIKIYGYKDKNNSIYCVEDNGIGIKQEHQEKIFEIFHQLNPRESKGEGLGLSLAKKIVERHKGKIWVESEINIGSKFYVSIPNMFI